MFRVIIKQRSSKQQRLAPTCFEFTPSTRTIAQKPPTLQKSRFDINNVLSLKERLRLMFLPKDYPNSVTKEYFSYTVYNFIHGISGTIAGTLSMQALLQALGASASVSIALSATTNWIIKDGVGLLGGVIYASLVSNKFDSHPKRYRFLSTLLIQMSCFLELLTPLFPLFFLPLASMSNIGKNIGWLASSASRAAMHGGFTRQDNLGDITAKAGAQVSHMTKMLHYIKNTAAGLIGTGSGIALSLLIGTDPFHLLFAFIPFCCLNLWTAFMANTQVVTRSLNNERADLLFMECFQRYAKGDENSIASTAYIATKETFVLPYKSPFFKTKLLQDTPLEKSLHLFSRHDATYFVASEAPYRVVYIEESKSIYLWYLENATPKDIIKGRYHASYIRYLVQNNPDLLKGGIMRKSDIFVKESFDFIFKQLHNSGWQTHFSFLTDQKACISIEKR